MTSPEDIILARAGLEPIASDLTYPLLIKDGDECWFTAVRRGVRVRVCKISAGELMSLNAQGATIALSIVPR